MLFTYMLAGWEGSTLDTYVLNSALDNLRNPFPRPPPGQLLHILLRFLVLWDIVSILTVHMYVQVNIY